MEANCYLSLKMLSKKRLSEVEGQMKEFANEDGEYSIYRNPNIDFLLSWVLEDQVPTKQDKFKPIYVVQVNEDGTETPIKDIYTKSEVSDAIKSFTDEVRSNASQVFTDGKRIPKPHLVEVIIAVSTMEKRFKEVDVDNLAKCVLDALNGIAFEDDSQVSSLMCQKFVHEMKVNSIMIAVTKLTSQRTGVLGEISLYSFAKWEED